MYKRQVPSRTGCNIQPETYVELAKHENIVAVKEANGNISAVAKTLALCGDQLDVYSGNDDQIAAIMALGGKGVISVLANICPKEVHEMTQKILDGDVAGGVKMQLDYMKLADAMFMDVNPIPVKEAANLMGYQCGECRLPLVSMNGDMQERLKKVMQEYHLI